MRAFNLEEAKNGAKVVTREGKPVRILTFDKKIHTYPIVALIEVNPDKEVTISYTNKGEQFIGKEDILDLFMAPVEHTLYGYGTINEDGTIGIDIEDFRELPREDYEKLLPTLNLGCSKAIIMELKYTL